jgi:hypothetical protein
VVYAEDDGKAFAEHAAAKCPEKDARGQPYFCAYIDRFDRVKDSRTKTWSYKPTE